MRVDIPMLNPIRLRHVGVDDVVHTNAFYRGYSQKFQTGDKTAIQVGLEAAPRTFEPKLISVDTGREYPQASEVFLFNNNRYQNITVDFNIPEGSYIFQLQVDSDVFVSDIICVKEKHENTIPFSYSNSENTQNVILENGLFFLIRVEADYSYNSLTPKSDSTVYERDFGEFIQIFSSPYDTFRLNIGGITGIPDWLISIVNRAFSCDTIHTMGTGITKVSGDDWEATSEANYNLRSWNIQIALTGDQFLYQNPRLTVNGQLEVYIDANPKAREIPLLVYSESDFSVSAPDSWASCNPVSGPAGYTNVTLKLTQNQGSEIRQSEIVVSDEFGNTVLIHVRQSFGYLTVNGENPFTRTVESLGVGLVFEVESSSNWEITGQIPPEVQFSRITGPSGSTTVTAFVDPNEGIQRTFVLTFSGDVDCVVTLIQDGGYLYFNTPGETTLNLSVDGAGEGHSVPVNSSSPWILNNFGYTWITAVKSTEDFLNLIFAENNTGSQRTATLVVSNQEGFTGIINISQGLNGRGLIDPSGNPIVDKNGKRLISIYRG